MLGFEHYKNIFLRRNEPDMTIPVAIITDSDVREYEKVQALNDEGKPLKDDKTKNIYNFEKIDVEEKRNSAITNKEANSEKNIKYFVAPLLFKSNSLSTHFKNAVESIHTGTNWEDDFEMELAKKLINKGLEKTKIAYKLANVIDEDLENETPSISIQDEDTETINYLIKSLKYVTGN